MSDIYSSWRLVQTLDLVLPLVAALFLVRGNFDLSPGIIAELVATKWDYNEATLKSICDQKADTWVGTIFTLGAFVLEVGWQNPFVPYSSINSWAVWHLVVFVIVVITGYLMALLISKRTHKKTINLLKTSSNS